MKILKFAVVGIIAIIVLYFGAIFLGFNLPKPQLSNNSIEGDAELKVTLLMDNNAKNPLPNIEVDIAEKPGPPSKGGVAVTNESGVATFKIKPGNYYIYFNDMTFPKNLRVPQLEQITVTEGITNEKTILITTS